MTDDKDKAAPFGRPGFDAGTPNWGGAVPMLPLPVQAFECHRCKGDGLLRNAYGEIMRNVVGRCGLCGGSGLVSNSVAARKEATK